MMPRELRAITTTIHHSLLFLKPSLLPPPLVDILHEYFKLLCLTIVFSVNFFCFVSIAWGCELLTKTKRIHPQWGVVPQWFFFHLLYPIRILSMHAHASDMFFKPVEPGLQSHRIHLLMNFTYPLYYRVSPPVSYFFILVRKQIIYYEKKNIPLLPIFKYIFVDWVASLLQRGAHQFSMDTSNMQAGALGLFIY